MLKTYETLKAKQRSERDGYGENLGLRVHRALSWLNRAEMEESDPDSQFIFLWIAFNSAYAQEYHDPRSYTERDAFGAFIAKLCELDKTNTLYNLVWSDFASSIRVLLNNKFVFAGFWEFQRGNKTADQWELEFNAAKTNASKALGQKDTSRVLSVVFSRLYTLRNQMLHGGATWNSSVNVDQKRDSVQFLGKFVPAVIGIMMDNAQELWGDPSYPVVND